MSDEFDDDDLLTETQFTALQAGRDALVATIERRMDRDERQLVRLVIIAVAGLFSDMLAASAALAASDPNSSM